MFPVVKGFQVLFAVFLIYFAVLLFHYHFYLATFPYPETYREGASMATTTMLLHGVKPFNYQLEPQYTNIYGIVYSLIALPWVKLFGEKLVVYRVVTAFFIFASCFVVFFVLYKKKVPLLLNFWALLALYASLLFPLTTSPCVDPASTGLFFMLLTIFIPFFLNYSNLSLILSIFCGVIAFYTKLYFFWGIPVMATYLFFFISKRKSLFFVYWSLICFTFSVVMMNHFFSAYFDDCFFMHVNYITKYSMKAVLERQLFQFTDLNKGMLFLILLVFFYSLWRYFMTGRPAVSLQWKDWGTPLITHPLSLEIYALICFSLVLLLLMGKQYGANLWYFFQLFSPFLVISIACFIGRFSFWPVVFSFLLIYNLFSLTRDDDYKYFAMDGIGVLGWQEIETLVKSRNYIGNSPLIAPLLIQENREVFDDGHTESYWGGALRKGLTGNFLKKDQSIDDTHREFDMKIFDMMKNKRFNLIIIEVGYPFKTFPRTLSNYYKYINSILVNAPQDRMPYLMTIWRPN